MRKTPSRHKTEQGLARARGSSLPARRVTEDKHLGSLPGGSTWDLCGFLCVRTRADGSARPVRSRTRWLGDKETLRDDDLIFRVPGPVDHAFTTLHGEVDVSHHGHRWKPLDAGHYTIQHTRAINTDEQLHFESGCVLFLLFVNFKAVNVTLHTLLTTWKWFNRKSCC